MQDVGGKPVEEGCWAECGGRFPGGGDVVEDELGEGGGGPVACDFDPVHGRAEGLVVSCESWWVCQ